MIRLHPLTAVAAFGTLCLTVSLSSAQVLFSDDFNNPEATTLPGKLPLVGQAWTQPNGPAMTVQGGAINTAGAARTAFGGFAAPYTGAQRFLKLTVDFTGLSHNGGYAGVSLFDGDQEKIFFGDPSGENPSVGFDIGGTISYASPVTPQGLLTLIYDRQTGRAGMYSGAVGGGRSLVWQTAASGLNFDRVRIQNDAGGDVATSSITVEELAQAPVSIDEFDIYPQISVVGSGADVSWATAYADGVTISPAPGAVAAEGQESIALAAGDTTYQIVANDSVGGGSASASTTVRAVVGGPVNFRYLRFTPLQTRGGGATTQLAELIFYENFTPVPPVQVTSPGANNPGAAEDFTKVADGLDTTKWLDFASTPLVFDFGTPVAIDHYAFVSANDAPDRDPIRWIFEGSADGVNWVLVENVSNFAYHFLTARQFLNDPIPFPGTSVMPYSKLTGNNRTLVAGDGLTLSYQTIAAQTVVIGDGSTDLTMPVGSGKVTVYPTANAIYTLTATNALGIKSTAALAVNVITPAIQQIAYGNFETAGGELALTGSSAVVNDFATRPQPGNFKRLRLTAAVNGQSGSAWFRKRQNVVGGFDSSFGAHITRTDNGSGADGMAFIIQNSDAGSDLIVGGAENGTQTKALSIALDGYQSTGEASGALLRVASAGQTLKLVDLATVPGITLRSPTHLLDPTGQAAPYAVRIVYADGLLSVTFEGVLVVDQLAVDLTALGAVDQAGTAVVGFAARTGGLSAAHDITSWTLTTGTTSPSSTIRLIASTVNKAGGMVSLTWESTAGKTYRITTSDNLTHWSQVLVDNIVGQPGQTTASSPFAGGAKGFFRVEEK